MEDGGAAAAPLSFEAFIRRIQEDPARDLVRAINLCARAARRSPLFCLALRHRRCR